jgi:hypothetical protein
MSHHALRKRTSGIHATLPMTINAGIIGRRYGNWRCFLRVDALQSP